MKTLCRFKILQAKYFFLIAAFLFCTTVLYGQTRFIISHNESEADGLITKIERRDNTDPLRVEVVSSKDTSGCTITFGEAEEGYFLDNKSLDAIEAYLLTDAEERLAINANELHEVLVQSDQVYFKLEDPNAQAAANVYKRTQQGGPKERDSKLWIILAGIGGLLIGLIASALYNFKKKDTIQNEQQDMVKKEFLTEVCKELGIDTKLRRKEEYETILSAIQAKNEVFESIKNAKLRLETEKDELNKELKGVQAAWKDAGDQLDEHQKQGARIDNFINFVSQNYLDEFKNAFSTGAPMHPLPEKDKSIFTHTIYALAFHFMSLIKVKKQQASEFDKQNIGQGNGESINSNTYKNVNILNENNIQDYNGVILFIAQELKKNGVLELKDVSFQGHYFKD